MEVFVARQPIFDRLRNVFGYELLFRSGLENVFRYDDPDLATLKVINHSLFLFGLQELTAGTKAFINFTRDTLLSECATLLPKESVVVEVLETVEPDDDVVAACRSLKQAGYLLALDDFTMQCEANPLVGLADLIKVDFSLTNADERRYLVQTYTPRNIVLLAEKVESQEDFDQARAMGYSYFQGYFFSKPAIISGNDVPGFKLTYIQLLNEINKPEVDFKAVEDLIKREVSLSYKLLRYINSVAFSLRHRINSVGQALLLLGQSGIKRWGYIIVLADMGVSRPIELVINSVLRARFCELIGEQLGLGPRNQDLFLVGLFSMLDAIIGRPLPDLLRALPVAQDIKDALLGAENSLSCVFQLVLAYESGHWANVSRCAQLLGLPESAIPDLYLRSVDWSTRAARLEK